LLAILALGLTLSGCDTAARWREPAPRAQEFSELSLSPERRGVALRKDFFAVRADIDPRKSLVVTERAIVERFSFTEVMETLVRRAGEPSLTPLGLFQSWWDTQNGRGAPPRCLELRFGFPYACPRAEGRQATMDPFANPPHGQLPRSAYIAIGLFNRMDLADPDQGDCGEHRIVFARVSGLQGDQERVLLNFEAVLPNPGAGIEGCGPIAEFWAGLSAIDDPGVRADRLRAFYFDGEVCPGCPRVRPVIHPGNYGARDCPPRTRCATGQIRTNQFMQGPWILREFRLARPCPRCALAFIPARTAQTPYGGLFDDVTGHPLAERFRKQLLRTLATRSLLGSEVETISYDLPTAFDSAQSESCDPGITVPSCRDQFVEGNYLRALSPRFRKAIKTALEELGIDEPVLPAEHLVARVQALSCAGCHQLTAGQPVGPGLSWPRSRDFVHVSERDFDTVEDRFRVSEFVESMFDFRRGKLAAFLGPR
jgi:hypothetical protein